MEDAIDQKDIQEGKFFAVISYVAFLCIVSLILKKDNKFALFHAKEGLVLFVIEVICFILSVIPVYSIIKRLVLAFFIFISLIGILQAIRGSAKGLPVISDIANKIIL